MISILKHDVRKHFGAPLLLLTAMYILFSIAERQSTTYTYEVFLLHMLTEHYLIIYGVTPIFLLSVFRNLEENTSFIVIRCRNFMRYFCTKWLAIAIFSVLFTLLQVVIVLIIGIGLPLGNDFPVSSSEGNELFQYLEAFFKSPLLAMISSSVYMMIGLSFVGISILTVFHFFDRRVVTVIILLAYGIMAMSIKMPWLGAMPFITLNRYIILHHNFMTKDGVVWTVFGMAVLLVAQLICIRFAWHHQFSLSWRMTGKGIFLYYARALWTRNTYIVLGGIIVLLMFWKAQGGVKESVQDYFIRFFYGQEIGSLHLLTFLEQLIYYGTPLYLLAIFVETWCSDANLSVFIRIKQKRTWLLALLSNGILLQLFYIGFTFAFLFIYALLTNKPGVINTIEITEIIQGSIWPVFIGLKIIEFSILFLAFFLLFIWFRNVTVAFLIMMATYALNLIPNKLLAYNPAGLVTFSRLQLLEDSTGISLSSAFTILAGVCVLLVVFISHSYKRLFTGG